MPALRGITVAVGDWYAATLAVCLHQNMRHLVECLVVTTPADEAVKAVVTKVPGARVFETDAFYRPDANGVKPLFNKSLGLEEGFSELGREGWICVHDADVIFGDSLPLERLRPDCLHGARRRILDDPAKWHPGLDWNTCPHWRDGSQPIGFFQLFHADSIRDKPQWYDVSFGHCGGGDAFLLTHWPPAKRILLPFDVLHLGPTDLNWMGTSQAARDVMAKYVHHNRWRRAMEKHSRESVERAGELPVRLSVPGYEPTGFDLPFERRARQERHGH